MHFGDTKHRPKPATYLTDLPGFGLPRQILIFRETQAKQGVFLDFQNYEIEGCHRKGQNRPNTATYFTDFGGFGLPLQILIFAKTQAKQGVFLDFQNYEIEGVHQKGKKKTGQTQPHI